MSSYSDNLLNKKLGLGYLSKAFAAAGFDNAPHPNPRIREYKFDVINLGTLRNVVPTAVLRKNLYADIVFSRRKQWAYENIIIKNDQKIYEVISQLSFNFYGDYSYFSPYKIRFEVLNTNFFKQRLETRPTILKNIDRKLPYTRLQFPLNLSNTNILTGSRAIYRPISIQNNLITSNYYVSGYNSGINYANRNTFLYRRFDAQSGAGGFVPAASGYIPYPNSVAIWQYPVFSLGTKIALDSVYTYANMYRDMKGLLVASLRSPSGTEKVVYVSPHEVRNKFYNVIIDSIQLQPSKIQTKLVGGQLRYEYVQVNSGITVNVLDIDSEYYGTTGIPGKNVFESGISLAQPSITGNIYSIKNNLKQTTPLKDTWFYKFYSGLYTSNKTLSTGTWDGIIPSGHSITLEYITTKDHRMGTDNEFRFIYQNYGDNSFIDQSIRNVFKNPIITETGKASLNPPDGTIITDPITGMVFTVGNPIQQALHITEAYNRAVETWKSINGSNFTTSSSLTRRGFGMSYDLRDAINISNNILRKGINTLYNQYRKLLPSGITIYPENSKTRRFRNLYTTNTYDYVSITDVPSGTYGCFKFADKSIICIDPPRPTNVY